MQLAQKAGVGWATVQRIERVDGIPQSRSGTLQRVVAALEAEGIEFTGDPIRSPGVRLRPHSSEAGRQNEPAKGPGG